jgi:nitrite reductase/ring-hydroxylating ferredoxin subunit
MPDRNDDKVRIGSTAEFADGRGRAVDFQGKRVAVFRRGERWFALQDSCPHMGASLAQGSLDGNAVVCHWHDKRFDLKTGESDMRSGACAKVYAVEVVDDQVFLLPPPPTVVVDDDDDWIPFDPDRHFKKNS